MDWYSIKKFCEMQGEKCKNDKQRHTYIAAQGCEITLDNEGNQGVAVKKNVEGHKNFRAGKRVATVKIKEQEFASRQEAAAAYSKGSAGMMPRAVTKEEMEASMVNATCSS